MCVLILRRLAVIMHHVVFQNCQSFARKRQPPGVISPKKDNFDHIVHRSDHIHVEPWAAAAPGSAAAARPTPATA